MKLSVILPCYNGAQTIAVQLDALTNQTYSGNWELVVVNNGSTDNSVDIVESYRDRLPHLRVVDAYTAPGPRLGVSHSYNVGLKAATGDAFIFCEADDEVSPTWLTQMSNALQRYQCVTGALEYSRLNEPWIVKMHGKGAQSTALMEVGHAPYLPFAYGCNLGFHRSVYETIGEIDESFPCAWDMDYSFRMQLAGFHLHFDPEIVIHYRVRHSLRAIYRQSTRWGEDNPLIRKRYGVGLGKLELPRWVVDCILHLFLLPIDFNRTRLARWLFDMGWKVGEIRGIIKHFILANFKPKSVNSTLRQKSLLNLKI